MVTKEPEIPGYERLTNESTVSNGTPEGYINELIDPRSTLEIQLEYAIRFRVPLSHIKVVPSETHQNLVSIYKKIQV
jgi:hypothetical protein